MSEYIFCRKSLRTFSCISRSLSFIYCWRCIVVKSLWQYLLLHHFTTGSSYLCTLQVGLSARRSYLGRLGGPQHCTSAGHVQPGGASLRHHGVPRARRPVPVPQESRSLGGCHHLADRSQDTQVGVQYSSLLCKAWIVVQFTVEAEIKWIICIY